MASLPILTVVEQSRVSPPPDTIGDKSLQLTFFDLHYLRSPPVHNLFFYKLPITRNQFTETTIVPNIKHSLSITLKHFYPFVGKLIVYPTPTKKPEIHYVEGDSVTVTFAECNLDFSELTGNHPRDCDKFYHLVPILGESTRLSDCIKIPLFSVQVTLFPNQGIAIGITYHHSLGDASTCFCFLKAWTSIARSGNNDESFIANGTFPLYDRVISNYSRLDEIYLKRAKVECFHEDYVTPSLSGSSDKQRATFILTRAVINQLKKLVSTQLPILEYVSSFTVACAYIWSCIAKINNDELQLFGSVIDRRARLKPPITSAYFGNCLGFSAVVAKANLLIGKEGFINAAKLLGENLHKTLTDYKDGVVKDDKEYLSLFSHGMPTTMTWVSGTPKLRFYDLDFGWGKPKKLETISIDYIGAISLDSCKESKEDLEIGVCISTTLMEDFVRIFEDGFKAYV
nr:malonyl-coenzyme A:anthocyanin 3-O-glucoside-6''-O-malonyltransferase-like [Tanacetum cinerariifolium]